MNGLIKATKTTMKKIISLFLHISKVLALNSQQAKFFAVSSRGRRLFILTKGVVSKETVVLRRWGSSIQKFGFINGVDNVN